MLPEFQGGSYDSMGRRGLRQLLRDDQLGFRERLLQSNFADGVTIQSNYMTVGGTNWGWLPAPFMYSSYDYGSAIRESGDRDSVGSQRHRGLQIRREPVLRGLPAIGPVARQTEGVAAPASTNSGDYDRGAPQPDDNTQFVYLRQSDATSTSDAQHASGAQHRTELRLHVRRHRSGAELQRHLVARCKPELHRR